MPKWKELKRYCEHDDVEIEKSKAALSGAANPNGSVAHSVHASVLNILQQIANFNNLTKADISSDEGRLSISGSFNESRSASAKYERGEKLTHKQFNSFYSGKTLLRLMQMSMPIMTSKQT